MMLWAHKHNERVVQYSKEFNISFILLKYHYILKDEYGNAIDCSIKYIWMLH
jgi:hypothetical protein